MQKTFSWTHQVMMSRVTIPQLTFHSRARAPNRSPLPRCLQIDGSVLGRLSARRCSSSPPISHHKVVEACARKVKEAEGISNASERHSVDFHPSVWGDYFIEYVSTDSRMVDDSAMEQVQELKSEVRRMLASDAYTELLKKLDLIDQIQRLGIAYHFDRGIEESLEQVYVRFFRSGCAENDYDLHTTALGFRLLRQHGYRIPSRSVVKKHLRKALSFCISHLKLMEEKSLEVSHALKQCIHRGVPRLEARRYIENYQIEDSHDEVLLDMAKLDFNMTQRQHQREVLEITRWWKELDFRRKLPFARDRVVECYFWILGVYFEPKYSLARKILTKALAMISIIDDIYDIYGTAEELKLFTEAVERWDIDALDALPGYMQVCYSVLHDIYSEIEGTLADQGRSYYIYYAKEADITSEGMFEWLLSDPKILRASATACRLMDDIASHKFEQERGHIPSAVECYMKQYGVEEREAEDELKKRVDDAWKDINEECLRLTAVPTHVLTRMVNLTRMLDVVYKDGDYYTHSEKRLKNIISSLLVHPVVV